MTSNKRGIGKDTVNTLITQVFYFLITFITGVIVARAVGPGGKGIYSLVVLSVSFGVIFTGIGLPTANAYFAGKKEEKLRALIANSFFTLIISCIVLMLAFLILQHRFSGDRLRFIGFAFILTPCVLLIGLLCEIVHGLGKISESNLIKIFPSLITLLCIGVFMLASVHMITGSFTIITILFCWAVGNIFGLLFAMLILFREVRDRAKFKERGEGGIEAGCDVAVTQLSNEIKGSHSGLFRSWQTYNYDFKLFKESISFGSRVWLNSFIGQLNLRFDMFLVVYFLTTKEVGYYSVATMLAGFLSFVPSSIAIALFPRFTRQELARSREVACKGIRITLFLNLFFMFALIVVGWFVVPLVYGDKFKPAVLPLLILLPGYYIFGIAPITTAYFNGAIGKPIINAWLAGVSLIMDIILNFILVPRFGICGTAVARTLSCVISMTAGVVIFMKLSGTGIRELLIIRKSDWKVVGQKNK